MSFLKKSIVFVCSLFLLALLVGWLQLLRGHNFRNESILINFEATNLDSIDFRKYTSVELKASSYYKADELKRFFQGANFRESWLEEVKVPILFLDTLKGGMEVTKEGGGKQTKSLRIENNQDLVMTLRSVNKNPESLVPEALDLLGLENIVTDGISGQHPYAASVIADLSRELSIYSSEPRLYFLPKQRALDSFNQYYGNRLYWLEYETKGSFNWLLLDDFVQITDTDNLQELKMALGDSLQIDKSSLIRARLFDIVIGDWDRHAKQWGWVITKSNSNYLASPMPVDRDNAFFVVDGLIPSLIEQEGITPHLQSHEHEIQNLVGMIYPFDIYFLQHTDVQSFIREARYIQLLLTETHLEKTFRKHWSKAMYERDAKLIIDKMLFRIQNLEQTAKRYKKILDASPLLSAPLYGSENLKDLDSSLVPCFDCR